MIYCINLILRENIYNKIVTEFYKIPLFNNTVNYLRVEKHEKGRRYGCFDSHIQCIKNAHNISNIDYVMIFEDNFKFTDNYEKNLNNLLNFLKHNKNNTDIDIIYSQKRLANNIKKKFNNNFYYGLAPDKLAFLKNYKLYSDKIINLTSN